MDEDDWEEDEVRERVSVPVYMIRDMAMGIIELLRKWHEENDDVTYSHGRSVASILAASNAAVELLSDWARSNETLQ